MVGMPQLGWRASSREVADSSPRGEQDGHAPILRRPRCLETVECLHHLVLSAALMGEREWRAMAAEGIDQQRGRRQPESERLVGRCGIEEAGDALWLLGDHHNELERAIQWCRRVLCRVGTCVGGKLGLAALRTVQSEAVHWRVLTANQDVQQQLRWQSSAAVTAAADARGVGLMAIGGGGIGVGASGLTGMEWQLVRVTSTAEQLADQFTNKREGDAAHALLPQIVFGAEMERRDRWWRRWRRWRRWQRSTGRSPRPACDGVRGDGRGSDGGCWWM